MRLKASKERNDAVAHVASIMAVAPITVGYTVESKQQSGHFELAYPGARTTLC